MDASPRKTIHPLMATAAIAVILFSVVGIGAITGVIPTSKSSAERIAESPAPHAIQPAPPLEQPIQPVPQPPATKSAPKAVAPAAVPPRPVAQRPATQPPAPVEERLPEPAVVRDPPRVAAAERAPQPRAICYDCGTVESVREVKQTGDGSGVGAVAGGVAGAVLGRQVGGGRGRDLATVAGAVGGAVAGHQIEKHVKSSVVYEITVRMDDGSMRTFGEASPPTWRTGDKVRVQGDRLTTQG